MDRSGRAQPVPRPVPRRGTAPGVGDRVVGVDVGGTGVRTALARLDPQGRPRVVAEVERPVPARTGPRGIDAEALLETLLPGLDVVLRRGGARSVAAVAVGATGMASLGADLAERLPGPLSARCGTGRLVLAADAVAAYAGALGARPGVVVAAGTGMIALGTDLATGWRRADGWGHLLGDCGGGAWIGRAALDAALRCHDGRPGGSAALLALVVGRFGPVGGLPAAFQLRPDRAGLLASLAPAVAAARAEGDPVAAGILRRAAEEMADTAAAAATGLDRPAFALTGGLFEMAGLREEVGELIGARLPGAGLRRSEGDPLLGALRLAAGAARGELPWPVGAPLLRLVG
ncbi:BadF/BadG/BcrA/BcrD ATPase family protein [Streptomyces antimicrobicus]|uniref:ATPase n=1 Tax=Streptomyces antimicrobicus TaxID=2883108 RepID=A0ABS8BF85_9ACTN|nr:BadF/BadG/BcrA/BcrD ATPase family protein [Streptomyces antimicrobicus]MCB5183298.1 ATPase [Streptomyces antimicrobicus]